ncbi:hypothetical protein LIPSTDRAFT_198157 [Lipomyces starkeyi NRRL Y-11557]|uniref:Uncharacterized protein n=1 Tax=Lipomyces starkeyi NRRL Y-11557 TaxID=675824 RepID=A0A1E3PVD5_LIPST|nr:hypothetical protein LIPSTDRAFT_198157 [Lipomyces starkeyi NRRL Y-11557]
MLLSPFAWLEDELVSAAVLYLHAVCVHILENSNSLNLKLLCYKIATKLKQHNFSLSSVINVPNKSYSAHSTTALNVPFVLTFLLIFQSLGQIIVH